MDDLHETRRAAGLTGTIEAPPGNPQPYDAQAILFGTEEPPPFPEMNIFPLDWHIETPKLRELYNAARNPGWAPPMLPWHTLEPARLTQDQRYALSYWWALLSTFDGSGPVVFARTMIHTFETHEEDPVRQCFFSITRDEMNHEEVCGRAITALTPGGPLGYQPQTPLGQLAQNNIKWMYHNGARYWSGFKNGIHKYPLPILFTSFLMGEVASATLFHGMQQRTTIPVFKEAFRCIGQDEARHMGICVAVLEKLLPKLTDEQRATITRQIRAGFVFLSGILHEPPADFWELPSTFKPASRLLEDTARDAGLGILSLTERAENWRAAVLKLKGLLEPHGIAFPALPEVGIDGETVAFDPADIVPVF
jgi:rubrerythrin